MGKEHVRSVEFIDWTGGSESREAACRYHQRTSAIDAAESHAEPYRGSLFLDQVSVCWDGRPVTAVFSMAAGYICARLCDASSGFLKAAVPHRYVYGRYHGTGVGRDQRCDLRLDAHGQEGVVEELERRIWTYEEERVDLLLTHWEHESRECVYLLEDPDLGAGTIHVVLSDRAAFRRVRGQSLVATCQAIERPVAELEEAVAEEKRLLARFIEAQRTDVVGSWWNRVRRLPQRPRIETSCLSVVTWLP